jgi:hypothetical protein
MNTQDMMTDIIILLFPIFVAVALWVLRLAEQRLPAQQRESLEQFATYVVKKIEQQYSGWSSDKKKAYAESVIIMLFKQMHLPPPSNTLIDAAIEAIVFELKESKSPNTFTTQPLINTGPIKPIQPGGQPV